MTNWVQVESVQQKWVSNQAKDRQLCFKSIKRESCYTHNITPCYFDIRPNWRTPPETPKIIAKVMTTTSWSLRSWGGAELPTHQQQHFFMGGSLRGVAELMGRGSLVVLNRNSPTSDFYNIELLSTVGGLSFRKNSGRPMGAITKILSWKVEKPGQNSGGSQRAFPFPTLTNST